MDTDSILYKNESHRLIGCAIEVHNELGHGFHEKPYENALVVEFQNQRVSYEQQRRFNMVYKTVKVGEYIPDLIAFGKIVVDVKVIDQDHGARNRADVELPENHRFTTWIYYQLSTFETGMGENHPVTDNQCLSVSSVVQNQELYVMTHGEIGLPR